MDGSIIPSKKEDTQKQGQSTDFRNYISSKTKDPKKRRCWARGRNHLEDESVRTIVVVLLIAFLSGFVIGLLCVGYIAWMWWSIISWYGIPLALFAGLVVGFLIMMIASFVLKIFIPLQWELKLKKWREEQ